MAKKKRVIYIIVLAMAIGGLLAAAWPVYAADVGDALYIADITAANSGEAASKVAVAIDINDQALINDKYITEDLLNTAIHTAGGGDVPYMPGVGSNPWIYFLPSIGASESKPYLFYCGGPAMQTGFHYFPDDGGMTTDDSASLELGDNFTIEQKVYVDTSTGSNKYLIEKEDAFKVYVSGDEEISAGIYGGTPYSAFSSSYDGYIYYSNATYSTAQGAASGTVDRISTTFDIGQAMASYPTVEATNGGTSGALTTSHPINMPSGIESGDLLLIVFATGYQEGTTHNTPSGWSLLFSEVDNTYTRPRLSVYYKTAAGGDTATIITNQTAKSAHTTYRISGWGAIQCGTAATGVGTNPDPPSLSPSWGSKAALWLAVCATDDGKTVSSYPSNYTDGLVYTNGSGGDGGTGSARREYTSATENPGTFTLSGSCCWVANTIAIRGEIYLVDRGVLFFDTSAIPDDAEIAGASLYLYGSSDSSTTDFDLIVQSGMPTYPHSPPVSNDYKKNYYTGEGNDAFNTSGFSTSEYNDIDLNSTGLSWINKTGKTKLCVRSSRDIAVTTPTGDEYVTVYASEETGTSKDPYLEVYYYSPFLTATGITSGLRRVVVTADTTDFTLSVYDGSDVLIDSDTAALGGVSVTNNANGWSFLLNGSAIYMEYQKIWVGGTLKQHIVYERDTTFQDQTAYNNDATPTFITTTTDPDITATFESFRPISESEYTGGACDDGGGVITTVPDEPEEFYTGGGTGFDHLPGVELINTMLDAADFPRDLFWIWLVYGLAALSVLVGYQFMRSSLLYPALLGFVVILGAALTCKGDPIELWTILPYGLMSAGFVVSERVYGW